MQISGNIVNRPKSNN